MALKISGQPLVSSSEPWSEGAAKANSAASFGYDGMVKPPVQPAAMTVGTTDEFTTSSTPLLDLTGTGSTTTSTQ